MWVRTFNAIKTENMSIHLNAFGKWKFKQSFIHLTKMVVLKMLTGQDFPFKKETLLRSISEGAQASHIEFDFTYSVI